MIDDYYLKILKENIGDIWLEKYVWNDEKNEWKFVWWYWFEIFANNK